ncbi:MAG: Competence protein A [Planctomycetes bacterium ADurb.Bin126]|nr:MAG: Competence protein A [Planctomycetes bacterium ADurb.Bin126]HOD82651.1 pilus assembly protein PilM [Phycisphaerae bacterium]HQL75416.1 pilus assembly protein PilM [Phycisphaerae bacterium]
MSVLSGVKKLVSGLPRRFTAVDFDSRQMRIVHAEHVGGRMRVLKLHQLAMPPETDLSNAQLVGQVLGKGIRDLGLSGTGVLMNVPRGQAVLKPLTLPAQTPRQELPAMVQFQMEKELPFRPEEAVIDFTMAEHFDAVASAELSAAGAGVSLLVSAVRLPVVDYYRRVAEAAGVKLARLGLRPYASIQCVDACTLRAESETVAIVHVTPDETEINVLLGGGLTFSRSAVVTVLPPKTGSDPAVKETVDALATEVARSLQSYQAVQGGKKVDAILVAGGTGIESRLASHLAQRLLTKCEIFHPGPALGVHSDAPETSAFIAALGLAVGHCSKILPFDFLAPKRPVVRRDLKKIRRIAALAMAGVVLLGAGIAFTAHLQAKRTVLQNLRNKVASAQKENKDVKALQKRVKAFDTWLSDSRNWLDHWTYLSCLFPPCQDAYISDFRVNRSDGSISFIVKAREAEIITDLGKRLTEAGYEFRAGRETATEQDRYGYLHAADMKVILPPNLEMNLANMEKPKRPVDDSSLEDFLRPGYKPVGSPNLRPPEGSPPSASGPAPSSLPSSPEAPEAPAAPTAASPPPQPADGYIGTDGKTYTGRLAVDRKQHEKTTELYWQKKVRDRERESQREVEKKRELEKARERERERRSSRRGDGNE